MLESIDLHDTSTLNLIKSPSSSLFTNSSSSSSSSSSSTNNTCFKSMSDMKSDHDFVDSESLTSLLSPSSSPLGSINLIGNFNQNSNNKLDLNNNNTETSSKLNDLTTASFLTFSTFINKNLSEKEIREKFYAQYSIGAEIGKGGFGVIFGGYRKADAKPVAIKIIRKSKVTQWYYFNGSNSKQPSNYSNQLNEANPQPSVIVTSRIPLEIALMIRVRNVENCIRILDYLELKNCFIIIMERDEMCQDLFDFITEQPGGLNESQACDYFRQIVSTTMHIHELGVIHRDIKDDNILVN